MKQVWMFLAMSVALAVVSIPQEVWTQTSSSPAETYKVQRFKPDSANYVNVMELVTLRIGPADWYVFFAASALSTDDGIWRYDTRNKQWKHFGPANGVMWWVWTIFEGYNNRLLAGAEDGVFLTDDFGEHWRFVQIGSGSERILAFAKTSDGAIYAGSYGLFRSTDNGETWTQLLSKDTTYPYVKSIAIMPSGAILVGYGADNGTAKGGIWKSTDSGKTWFHSDSGLDSLKNVQRLVAVGGFSQMVFAMTSNGGIYRSEDEGENWQKTSYPVPRFGWLNGFDITPLGLFAGWDGGYGHRKLYRSIDYGEHWTELTGFNDNLPMCFGSMKPNELIVGTDNFGYLYTFDNPLKVEDPLQPATYQLSQNYPNPFNPSTTIEFTLPERSFVKLIITNILGQEVGVLVNEERGTGVHRVEWNARDLPSGIYFYRLDAKSTFGSLTSERIVQTKKMLLAK